MKSSLTRLASKGTKASKARFSRIKFGTGYVAFKNQIGST